MMDSRRVLRSIKVLAQRHLQDLSPTERARGRADRASLLSRFPGLADHAPRRAAVIEVLGADHADYTSRIGHPVHAASLELVAFLLHLIELRAPRRVVDLGSGFTSYALRRFAAEAARGAGPLHAALGGQVGGFAVTSVDDDPAWLGRTRGYLEEKGVSTDDLEVWGQGFDPAARAGSYDLVLHDMGTMETRERTLIDALALANAGGCVVLDDVHKPAFRDYARRTLASRRQPVLSARAWTRDRLTRYAWVALPDTP
jgi:predicted O-methyltransferase YrrM